MAKRGPKEKHGLWHHPIYRAYDAIISRCYNSNVPAYKNYGGRGISMCDEWRKDRNKFFSWAFENGYAQGLHIDRIDNNGNYSPENCRFVSRKINNNNKRANRFITYNEQTKTIAQWADIYGKPYDFIYDRVRRGWNIERILSEPPRNYTMAQ